MKKYASGLNFFCALPKEFLNSLLTKYAQAARNLLKKTAPASLPERFFKQAASLNHTKKTIIEMAATSEPALPAF
jgi:hypothetical protein